MNSEGPSESRRRLFFVATLLLPVVVLVAFELGLRLLGFGGDYPLFIDDPISPGELRASPQVVRRYVPSLGPPIARIDPFPFRRSKPKNGYRIVVQGGSTAAGFPYGRWAGLAGMLSDRLEATFPDREIEVVSTAMAAVNSYTLADLVDEIIEIEPDAVLVYAGHNEYLGILGVGSALSGSTSRIVARMQLHLRKLRLYQLVRDGVSLGRASMQAALGAEADRNSLFARAASGARIPFDSSLYWSGLQQFEANLDELLTKYERAGIPVYVGTLVSNEKDLAPFVGGPGASVDRRRWTQLRARARAQRRDGDTDGARHSLRAQIALDENAADAWYALGQLEREAGNSRVAREAYRAARDRDALRFRAPSAFNRAIRELAARHAAHVVEVEQHFSAASPDGLIGNELLLEHVHPNADGYFLLANAFYETLRRDRRIGDWPHAPTRAEAKRDMPLTEVDRLLADYSVRELEAGYPFSDPPRPVALPEPGNEVERLARRLRKGEIEWIDCMDALLRYYRRRGRLEDAARVARLAARDYPLDRGPNFAAGILLKKIGRPAQARRYLERSLRAAPGDVASLRALLGIDRALEDEARARQHRILLRHIESKERSSGAGGDLE